MTNHEQSITMDLQREIDWLSRELIEAQTKCNELEKEDARIKAALTQLPYSRDVLGMLVREAWVDWAKEQPNPKPHWLTPYKDLSESDKEADRRIGERVARVTLARTMEYTIPERGGAEL